MRKKILIVDDVDINREMLGQILESDYIILEAANGNQALTLIRKNHNELAAILLDLIMPEMDGFQVLETLNKENFIGKIPVLVITGERTIEAEECCFSLGVSDFIRKPFTNSLVRKRVKNVSDFFEYKNNLEKKVDEQTVFLRKACQKLQVQADRLQKQNAEIIDIMGTIVEYRNIESGEHIQRVKDYTKVLAQRFMTEYPEYNLTPQRIETIVLASALHDIGKITIPDSILLKPGRLTAKEFECMKSHTTKGCEILNAIKVGLDAESKHVSYEICRHHHERYDGKGYPDGLIGEQIPISAQLVSIADVYDALVNKRCYKDAFPKEEAFHMITNGECGAFSPKLIDVFCKVRKEFEAIQPSL